MDNTTKILCIYMGEQRELGGCEIYRGNMPLHYLGEQEGWHTNWMWFHDVVNAFKMSSGLSLLALIDAYDIFVFPRWFAANSEMLDGMMTIMTMIRHKGKKIVYEVDDDYTNRYREVVDGDAIAIATASDAITVSTPLLAKYMTEITGRPSHVAQNCIDPVLWRDLVVPPNPMFEGKTVIGLTGSPTHAKDWEVVAEPLRNITNRHDDVIVLVMGCHPDYLKGLNNTNHLKFVAYPYYAQIIRHCDIILAPVDPNDRFNLSKSPIKAIEGMGATKELSNGKMGGAAVIATGNPVYRMAIKDGKTGLLVEHTPEAWEAAIESLVSDPHYSNRIRRNGWKHVYKNFNIQNEWKQWASAYSKVLLADSNPTPLIHL